MKLILLIISFIPLSLLAQCWDGGNGTDGVFNPSSDTTITGATYQFTSFTIGAGITVTVTGNNPLIIYCQGTATIDGVLSASGGNGMDGVTYVNGGIGGIGVAGGGNGGDGTFSSSLGPIVASDGMNSGGINTKGAGWSGGGGAGYAAVGDSSGNAAGGFGGAIYSDQDLSGMQSGSGGGGGSGGYDCGAGGGGAGGGIINLYVNTLFLGASGTIEAQGGDGGSDGNGNCGGGGGGSGGTIFISTVNMTNNGTITVAGGTGGASQVAGSPYYGTGGNGSPGRIRIDHTNTITGSGTIIPAIGSEHFLASPAFANQAISICDGESITIGMNTYSVSGTYQDTLATVYGCDSILTTVLTVNNPVSSSQTVHLCDGESITVGSNTYSASGTYQDVFMAANGCDSTLTTILTVDAPINANVTVSGFTLTAESGTGNFQWVDCNNGNAPIAGETSGTFTPAVNGDYAVVVTVNNCSVTSTCHNISGLGIQEQLLSNVLVFPNPTNGNITVQFASSQAAAVNVTDVTGRVIRLIDNCESGTVVDLAREAKGVYFLNIAIGNQVKTIKVTKQ